VYFSLSPTCICAETPPYVATVIDFNWHEVGVQVLLVDAVDGEQLAKRLPGDTVWLVALIVKLLMSLELYCTGLFVV
jgi:hypothetical protein